MSYDPLAMASLWQPFDTTQFAYEDIYRHKYPNALLPPSCVPLQLAFDQFADQGAAPLEEQTPLFYSQLLSTNITTSHIPEQNIDIYDQQTGTCSEVTALRPRPYPVNTKDASISTRQNPVAVPALHSLPETPSDSMSISAEETRSIPKAHGRTPQANRAIGRRYRQKFNRQLEKLRDTLLEIGALESNQAGEHYIDARWQTKPGLINVAIKHILCLERDKQDAQSHIRILKKRIETLQVMVYPKRDS